MAMQWISVKKRLPDNVSPVIACQAGVENNAYGAIYCRSQWWQGCHPARPTHWMPFPAPPLPELPDLQSTDEPDSGGLKCPHCKKALRLEQYTSYFAIHDTKVCPYCGKVMQIGHRLAKADA